MLGFEYRWPNGREGDKTHEADRERQRESERERKRERQQRSYNQQIHKGIVRAKR